MGNMKNLIYGIILGIANVIPGVSGATIAVILNIYDKILFALSRENLIQNINFLRVLATGILIGIFTFSKTTIYLFENYLTGFRKKLDPVCICIIIDDCSAIYSAVRIKPEESWLPAMVKRLRLYLE